MVALLWRGGVSSLKERISPRGEMPEERRSGEKRSVSLEEFLAMRKPQTDGNGLTDRDRRFLKGDE